MSAIERVNAGAVAAQRRNDRAIGVEHDGGFVVTLFGAGRDGFTDRLRSQRRRNPVRHKRVGVRVRYPD